MLQQLTIHDIVLIEALDIPFQSGFCVLTGETGAGKSILLDALGLVLGKRAEARLVRHGAEKGVVTATFSAEDRAIKTLLNAHAIDAEEELLLRRVLYADGKSKAFINDCPVSIQLLQQVGASLVEIHGQHTQQGLLAPNYHRHILDAYGGLEASVTAVTEAYTAWQEAEKRYEEAQAICDKTKGEEDYLRHVLQELEQLDPQIGEEEKLAEQRSRLMHQEKITETLEAALGELHGSKAVASALRSASRILERSSVPDKTLFSSALEALDRATIEVDEAESALEASLRQDGDTNLSLDDIEERLFALREAARKYRVTPDALPEHKEQIAQQLDALEHSEDVLRNCIAERDASKKRYQEQAEALHAKRLQAAQKLEKAVAKELTPLKMANSAMQIACEPLPESGWGPQGMERVEFRVRTNPGAPFGPMAKIASGGELSRFMLALKVVLAHVKSAPTLIFDEIDSGIGGAVADAVGQRLEQLGTTHQVLAVTHQPQVAAHGQHHLRVEKRERAGAVTTTVTPLSEQQRQEEVARMLAGKSITEEARAAAGKLMQAS